MSESDLRKQQVAELNVMGVGIFRTQTFCPDPPPAPLPVWILKRTFLQCSSYTRLKSNTVCASVQDHDDCEPQMSEKFVSLIIISELEEAELCAPTINQSELRVSKVNCSVL
jgi:hypothetical protein